MSSLSRTPRFSIPAVLMLAGGVSVSSVCYAVLEAAVLKAVPYDKPRRLVEVGKNRRFTQNTHWKLSKADFDIVQTRARCWDALGYEVDIQGSIIGGPGGQAPVMEARISPGLFEALRLRPALGRPFHAEDFERGSSGAILLSFGLWANTFSSDPSVVGKHVLVDGADFTVIGVMPEALRRPVSVAEVWIPDRSPEDGPNATTVSDKLVIARLREGTSLTDAQHEIAALQPVYVPGMRHTNSDADRFALLSFADQIVGPANKILSLLLGACLSIQVLACLNVGHLLLARRMSRARDLGIQLALGSGTTRLCLDVLLETIGIALAAVFVAIPLVLMLLPAATAVTSMALGSGIHAGLSISVLAFSIGLGLVSSPLCAIVPVILLRRLELTSLINERWHMGELSLSASRLQDLLIVIQVAAAVVLMAGFGLLAKSVYRLSGVSLGFDAKRLSYVMFDRSNMSFPASALKLDEALASLSQLPTVKSVAVGSTPLLMGAHMNLTISVKTDEGAWVEVPPVPLQSVSGGYFSTMGIPLLKGRTFDRGDVKGTPCVAVVNRSFARLMWSTADAVGKQIDLSGGSGVRAACDIVGVVGDARDIALASPPEPELFFSHLQKPASANATVLIRTTGRDAVPVETVHHMIAAVDPTRRMSFSTDIGALVGTAVRPSETRAKLLGSLAVLALLLAAGGMYAAATYSLSERAKEFGIRLAMGAATMDIVFLIYRHYAKLAGVGGLIGVASGATLSRYFNTGLSLFEGRSFDIEVFAVVPIVCVLIVLASIAAPTFRALGVNPSLLLRGEVN